MCQGQWNSVALTLRGGTYCAPSLLRTRNSLRHWESRQLKPLKVIELLNWAPRLFPLRGPATCGRLWRPGLGWAFRGKGQGNPARFCATNSVSGGLSQSLGYAPRTTVLPKTPRCDPTDGTSRQISHLKVEQVASPKQTTAQKDPSIPFHFNNPNQQNLLTSKPRLQPPWPDPQVNRSQPQLPHL